MYGCFEMFPPPQYGYIIIDKSLCFINHQNPPFFISGPILYKTTLYTNKIQYPTFSEFQKPTLSKVWVLNYGQVRLSLLLLLGQNCTPNLRWACFFALSQNDKQFLKRKKNYASILKQIVWETRPLWENFPWGASEALLGLSRRVTRRAL